jgi:hypothetical protein
MASYMPSLTSEVEESSEKEWHHAGYKEKKVVVPSDNYLPHFNPFSKSNCFDDFIAATYVFMCFVSNIFFVLMLFLPVIFL